MRGTGPSSHAWRALRARKRTRTCPVSRPRRSPGSYLDHHDCIHPRRALGGRANVTAGRGGRLGRGHRQAFTVYSYSTSPQLHFQCCETWWNIYDCYISFYYPQTTAHCWLSKEMDSLLDFGSPKWWRLISRGCTTSVFECN